MVNGPMGGNMGTPAAPSQPPQVNFETTAESRGNFNNFLRSIPQTTNMTPLPPMGSTPMPPMGGNPMANIDIFNQPMGMMGINQPPMNPMMQPPMQTPMMMADGGNVDRNDIGVENFADKNGGIVDGLPRMWKSSPDQPMTYLSYITGEEQNFLRESNIHDKDDPNRIGQPGPKGVPSFDDPGGDTEDEGSDYGGDDDDGDGEAGAGEGTSESEVSDAQEASGGYGGDNNDNTDYSDPDSDIDYTDVDYGYTTQDTDTGKDDMDRATEIGQAVATAQAAADEIQNRALAAQNKANINQAINQNKANQQSLIDTQLSLGPSKSGTTTVTTNNQPRGTDVDRDAAVQAAANTNFSNIGAKGIDEDLLGLDLTDVGLGLGFSTPSIGPSVASGPGYGKGDITGFGGQKGTGRDVSDFSLDIDALSGKQEDAKKGTFFRDPTNPITAAINALSKIGPKATLSNIAKGYAPTYDQKTGQITGTSNYGIGMGMPSSDNKAGEGFGMGQGPLGNIFGTGKTVPDYDVFEATQPSVNDDTTDIGGNESDPLIIKKRIKKPIVEDPIIDDRPPNVIGGGDPSEPVQQENPFIVASPFTTGVGDYNPVDFDVGDLNALIARLTGIPAPQSMKQGGVAGYAGGGLISAVDNFLASV